MRRTEERSKQFKVKQTTRQSKFNIIIHVLMKDEKDGRKKQARLNKQQGKVSHNKHVLMRDEHVQLLVYLPVFSSYFFNHFCTN